MKEELISVIVPVYKVEEYLGECIDSIVSQTYRELEIILVDDGSPDNCPAICDEYSAADDRIKVIHKENGGVSSARNAGLRAAGGRYIGWVDPDDIAEKNMFEELYKALTENKSDISVCGVKRFEMSKAESFYGSRTVSGKDFLKSILSGETESFLWNKLFKKELFDGVDFPNGEIFEDFKMLDYICRKAGKVSFTDSTFYNYRIRRQSITTVNKGIKAEAYISAAQARNKRYENTEFYYYSLTGELRCLRIVLSEMTSDERKSEMFKKHFRRYKELFRLCKSSIHGVQKILFGIFYCSPSAYSAVKKLYFGQN